MMIVSGNNKRSKTTPEHKWVLQTKGTTENNRDEVRGVHGREMFVVGDESSSHFGRDEFEVIMSVMRDDEQNAAAKSNIGVV